MVRLCGPGDSIEELTAEAGPEKITFTLTMPSIVQTAKSTSPKPKMKRGLGLRNLSAATVAPTETPRTMVTTFIRAFEAVSGVQTSAPELCAPIAERKEPHAQDVSTATFGDFNRRVHVFMQIGEYELCAGNPYYARTCSLRPAILVSSWKTFFRMILSNNITMNNPI